VRHVVAAVLNVLELPDAGVDVLEVFQSLLEKACTIAKIAGHFSKHIEKFCVFRDKTNHF
jgi:hypothetical protein